MVNSSIFLFDLFLGTLFCLLIASIAYAIRRIYAYKNDLAPKKRKW